MSESLPPILKLSERLVGEIEQAVRGWPRYHKYAHGTTLRTQAIEVLQLANRAWRTRNERSEWTGKLVWAVDDLKQCLQIGKQIKAFASFAQFEAIHLLAEDLGRQCGGWHKQQCEKHPKSQNVGAKLATPQRAQLLSARTASPEANP